MTDLTDAQRSLLVPALAREDRCIFPVTAPLKGGAVGNVARSLLKRGLVEEVPAGDVNTVWRHSEDGGPVTLRATDLAQQVLAGEHAAGAVRVVAATEPTEPTSAPTSATSASERGSAQQALLALLSRPEGASIAELQAATGWQSHSVRGALSGLIRKKLGHDVVSAKEERGRVYRITR